MSETTPPNAGAVSLLHGCKATWVRTIPVRLRHEDQPAWEGEVEVYALQGHRQALLCYVWTEPPTEAGGKGKAYTVLGVPPITSAVDAVLASIQERQAAKFDQ